MPLPKTSPWFGPCKITVKWDGFKPSKEEGVIHGRLAVVKCPDDPYWYVVHLGTGLLAALFQTEEDAKKVAEHLWSRCCLAFRLEDRGEFNAKMRESYRWVVKWVRHMREVGCWVDPEPYQREAA